LKFIKHLEIPSKFTSFLCIKVNENPGIGDMHLIKIPINNITDTLMAQSPASDCRFTDTRADEFKPYQQMLKIKTKTLL
jgi:hypothetical protein